MTTMTAPPRERSGFRAGDPRGTSVLLRRYARTRDPRVREELVRRFTPLAHRLALRYVRGMDQSDDLEQIAMVGLLKALDRFEPARGYAFSSYAVPTILGELKRSFRTTAWAVHVPRGLQERVAGLQRMTDRLSAGTGRTPTAGELAAALGWDEEEVVEAMLAARGMWSGSLDAPTDAGTEPRSMLEALGDEDGGYARVDDRATVSAAIPCLTDKEREVLCLRFGHDMLQIEIAERMGVSQMQISRVLRSALDRLGVVVAHQSRPRRGDV
jgi:RNA polymerase sigma-B factor